jgi:hypothetical protein
MRKQLKKAAVLLALSGGVLFQVGSCDSLFRNIWRGFGYGLGALPADVINSFITGFLIDSGIIPPPDEA